MNGVGDRSRGVGVSAPAVRRSGLPPDKLIVAQVCQMVMVSHSDKMGEEHLYLYAVMGGIVYNAPDGERWCQGLAELNTKIPATKRLADQVLAKVREHEQKTSDRSPELPKDLLAGPPL